MNFHKCEFKGCSEMAVIHVYERENIRHYCEYHAVSVMKQNSESVHGETVARMFSLLVRQDTSMLRIAFKVPMAVISLIPEELARRYEIVPVAVYDGMLIIAGADVLSEHQWDTVRFVANHSIGMIVSIRPCILEAIEAVYSPDSA